MKQITFFPVSNSVSGVSAEEKLNMTKKSKTIYKVLLHSTALFINT
jgi:hypothetical protein